MHPPHEHDIGLRQTHDQDPPTVPGPLGQDVDCPVGSPTVRFLYLMTDCDANARPETLARSGSCVQYSRGQRPSRGLTVKVPTSSCRGQTRRLTT